MNYLQKKKLAFMSIVNRVKGFVRTAVGVPPLVLPDCVGDNLINYSISGNSVQDGTPTPDNPVEIESVGEYDEATGKYKIPIKVRGKNLFDISKVIGNQNVAVNDGVVSIYKNGTAAEKPYTLKDYCPDLEVGKTYIISAKHNIKYEPYQRWYLVNTKVSWRFDSISNLRTLTITQEHLDDIVIWYKDSDVESNQVWDIQVEEGTVVTDYEPYQGTTETAIYLDEPLRKVGDYADYIDFENNKVVRNVCERRIVDVKYGDNDVMWLIFDDGVLSQNTVMYGNTTQRNRFGVTTGFKTTDTKKMLSNPAQTVYGLCTVLKASNSLIGDYPHIVFGWNSSTIFLLSFSDTAETKADLNNALAEIVNNTDFRIVYLLETSIEEPINLPNISTLKGTTILSPSTTVQPSSMSATYYSTSKE